MFLFYKEGILLHSNIHYRVSSGGKVTACPKTTSLLAAIMRMKTISDANMEVINADTFFFQSFEEAFIYLLHLPDEMIFYYCCQMFDWDDSGTQFIPQSIAPPIHYSKEETCERMLDYSEYETFYLRRGKNGHPYEIHCESSSTDKKGVICFYMK